MKFRTCDPDPIKLSAFISEDLLLNQNLQGQGGGLDMRK